MIHPKMKFTYVGVDSHKETHYAVALNCFYEKLGELEFKNSPGEFEEAVKKIQEFKVKGTTLLFGLEDTTNYGRSLTAYLVGRKHKVKHVNASLVAHERKNLNILHKTDSVDAESAARVLLSRFDTLPDADPQDKFWVLTNLVTRRRAIVRMNVLLKNHVQSYILSHYPSYSKFFDNFDCKTALTFFEKYPSPSTLQNTTVEELTELLEEHSNKRLRIEKAREILQCVKKDGDTTTSFQDARDLAVKSSISQINSNTKELQFIDSILEEFLDNFPYKLKSMRGIDTVTAANLIAEIGDIKRFPTPAKLSRYAGVAPVTYASGKTDLQFANEKGNRVLNSIFFHLSVQVTMIAGKNKKIINPYFYEYYNRKVSQGKTKRQALKCVQRRLVNIIWGMMKYEREYINPPTENLKDYDVRKKENIV